MEADWIRGFQCRLGFPPPHVLKGIGDDAACLLSPQGRSLLWTTDTQREHVHFRWEWMSPEDVGYRLFIANLSDILAKGGTPYAALVAIGVPSGFPEARLMSFYDGLALASQRFDCPVVGGDIARSVDGFNAVLSLLGTGIPGRFPGRELLLPGDALYLVGRPGLARVGYLACLEGRLSEPSFAPAVETFRRPRTFSWMPELIRRPDRLSASMDTSDGLGQAVFALADQSGVSICLDPPSGWLSHLDLSGELLGQDPFSLAWQGGEDYDLLLGVNREDEEDFVRRIERFLEGTTDRVFRLGIVQSAPESGKGVVWIRKPDGGFEQLERVGFDHTRG
ncbi:MAG: thiamine-phosphate kinase [Leptospirales bacterium]